MSKYLIAAATALSIGVGAMGMSTTSASAANVSGFISGPGFSIGFGQKPGWHKGWHKPRCHAVYKKQRVWSPRYGWTYARVKVGQRCDRPNWNHHRRNWR